MSIGTPFSNSFDAGASATDGTNTVVVCNGTNAIAAFGSVLAAVQTVLAGIVDAVDLGTPPSTSGTFNLADVPIVPGSINAVFSSASNGTSTITDDGTGTLINTPGGGGLKISGTINYLSGLVSWTSGQAGITSDADVQWNGTHTRDSVYAGIGEESSLIPEFGSSGRACLAIRRGATAAAFMDLTDGGDCEFICCGNNTFGIGTNLGIQIICYPDGHVEFTGGITIDGLPTGTIASPPSVNVGDVWKDTTTSAAHPILRIRVS